VLNRTIEKLVRKHTREQKQDIQAIAAKRDKDTDFSDAPRFSIGAQPQSASSTVPSKEPVTMRLDSDVIAWLKADGRGYQAQANWLLRSAMLHFTREANDSRRKVTATWQSQQAEETGVIRPDQVEPLGVLGQERHRVADYYCPALPGLYAS